MACFNVKGSARDASGPPPAENREAGNSVANSVAPYLFGRRQVQFRVPPMWDAASPWSAIFLKAAEDDETYWCDNIRHPATSWLAHGGRGVPKSREQLVAEAALAGGMAALVPESKCKSDRKRGKNKRARYTVDQDGVQLCFSWSFGGGTCGELSSGSPCPLGRMHKRTTCRSDKHSARQCPLTWQDQETDGIGTQEETFPSLSVPGSECLTFLRYFSGPVKFGLGEAISSAAARRGIKVRVINRDILRDGADSPVDEPSLRISRPP